MPRQLPWLNKGAGSRTQVKQPSKPRAAKTSPSDIDDDFFDGTVLASSDKGKAKAVRNDEDPEDDLPDLPAEPSTPRTKARTKDALRKKRAPSSSPPPIQNYVQPEIEYMLEGASKFDLRDDEWMMVEDEFLETAKLFTRHLHIAEYQKLKERIEAKKKEQVDAARPVVAGGKLSAEGTMKKKAEVQEKRQSKAIRDVFASQNDEDEGEDQAATSSAGQPRTASTSIKPPPKTHPLTTHDTDSDDLDTSRPSSKHPTSRPVANTPNPASALRSSTPTGQKSALPQAPTSSFAKPPLPTTKPRAITSRKSRATPFDMLDDYVPRTKAPLATNGREALSSTPSVRPSTPSVRSSSPVKPPAASTTRKVVELGDDWGSGTSGLSKATAERIAKRKAEREKEREGRRKGVKLDDIPTFLV